jgi:hypothetical protein
MKKLSKADMKKMKGGWPFGGGCGSICFYFSGGIFLTSTCVLRLNLWPPIPLPGPIPTSSCVCKATGASCGNDWVVV